MADERTRVMRRDGGRDPYGDEEGRRHLRYLVLGLLAVIVGLVVAIVILAGSDDGSVQTGVTGQVAPVVPTGASGPTDRPQPEPTPAPEPSPSPDSGGVTPSGGSSGGSSGGGASPDGGSSGGQSGGIGP